MYRQSEAAQASLDRKALGYITKQDFVANLAVKRAINWFNVGEREIFCKGLQTSPSRYHELRRNVKLLQRWNGLLFKIQRALLSIISILQNR